MHLNFAPLIAQLGPGAAFRLANAARAAGDYLFASILPEELRTTYDVTSASMTIRATMAGLVGMDSPYPPGGAVSSARLKENTAKLALQVPLTEQSLRTLQDLMIRARAGVGGISNQQILTTLLNFVQKVIVQPQLDTAEYLRGMALSTGALDWTFNGIHLSVNYNIPAGNTPAERTGNDGYGGSASKFHVDMRTLRRTLKSVRSVIGSPDTIDMIRYNAVNSLVTISESQNVVRVRRVTSDGIFTNDAGDVYDLVSYDKEAEVLDPAVPGTTKTIPFLADGILIGVGNSVNSAFGVNVGQGSTEDPDADNRLGYTHVAPTVEGGGTPGRWADVFTPENEPWSIKGRSVSNILPVIENPDKLFILKTAMV